jgi:poly-beta-1,6-N-acetyl-D-glucosamine synthase
VKCIRRLVEKPYLLGASALWFGFMKGYVKGMPQVDDKAMIRYFRQQQMNRLLGRKSLWS